MPQSTRSFGIVGWHARDTGVCLGEAWALLPSGLIVRDNPIFRKNGKIWVGLASKPVVGADGVVLRRPGSDKWQWTPVISFADAASRDKYNAQLLEALHRAHPDTLDRGDNP